MRPALISSNKASVTAALLLILQLICLLLLPERQLARCQQVPSGAPDGPIEIRIGFLMAGQQRGARNNAQAGRTYSSRPGRLMSHVFNYALDKLNAESNFAGAGHHASSASEPPASHSSAEPLLSDAAPAPVTTAGQLLRPTELDVSPPSIEQTLDVQWRPRAQHRTKSNNTFLNTTTRQVGSDVDGRRARAARAREPAPDGGAGAAVVGQAAPARRSKPLAVIFKPLLAETYGDVAESIKQTIDLITRQMAHVILGPQANTCQVEPIIAAIYNVPMLSHYCSHDQITTTISTAAPTTTSASGRDSSNAISTAQSTPTGDDHQHNERRVANPVVDQHQSHKVPLHQIVNAAGELLHANTFIQSKPPVWKIVKRVISLLRNLIDRNHDLAYELVLLYYKERPPLRSVKVGRTSTLAAAGTPAPAAAAAAKAASPDAWPPRDTDQNLLLTSNHGRTATPWPVAPNERPANADNLGHRDDHNDADESDDEQEAGAPLSARSNEADRFKIIGQLLEIKLSRLVGARSRRTIESSLRRAEKNATSARLPSATKDQSASEARQSAPQAPSAHSLAVLNWHTTFHYGYIRNPFRQVLRRHLIQSQRLAQQPRSQSTVFDEMAPTDHWSGRCEPMRAGAHLDELTSARQTSQAQPPASSIYIVVGHYYEHLGLMLALHELGLLDDESEPTAPAADDDDEDRRQTKRPSAPHSPMADAAANRRGQWSRNGGARLRHGRQPAIVIGVDIEPYDESDDSVRFLRGLLLDGVQPTMNANAAGPSDNLNEQSANSLASMYNNYLGVMPAKPSKSIELLDEMRHFYNKTQAPGGGGGGAAEDHQQQDVKLAQTILQLKQQSESKNASLLSIYDSNLLALRMLQFARLPVEAYYLYDSIMLLGKYYAECLASGADVAHCSEGRRMFAWFAGRRYSGYTDQSGGRFDAQARSEGSYSLLARRLPVASAQMRHNQSLNEGLLNELLAEDEFDIGPIGSFRLARDAIEFQVAPESIARPWWPLWCAAADHSSGGINSTIDCSIYHSTMRTALTANQSRTNEDANGHYDWRLFGAGINPMVAFVAALICLALVCVGLVATIALERVRWRNEAAGAGASLSLNQLLLGCQRATKPDNSSWFGARDVRNFLQIVHEFLLMPDDSLINEAHEQDEVSDWQPADGGKLAQLPEGHRNERLRGSARSRLVGATRAAGCQEQRQERQEDEVSGNSSRLATYGAIDEAALRQNIVPTFHLDRSPAMAADQAERDRFGPLQAGSVAIDLHCYMFAFPSCKFVHWLMALHKLKELLFKYQSSLSGVTDDIECGTASKPHKRGATLLQCAGDRLMFQLPFYLPNANSGADQKRLRNESSENNGNLVAGNSCATFFSAQHKHTATLRLLLNKHKATNECLCQLSQLVHPNLVRLLGVTLGNSRVYGFSDSKVARLLLECPERSHLRVELRRLGANQELGARAAKCFKRALWRPLLTDLINGLEFLHERLELGFHGQLNATNCLLTADWRLKLTGFHVTHMRRSLGQYRMRLPAGSEESARARAQRNNKFLCSCDAARTMGNQICPHRDESEDEFDASVYMAPEVLSHAGAYVPGIGHAACTTLGAREMRLADIYAFAFVLFELLTSQEPWSCRDDGADGVRLTDAARHRRHQGGVGRLIAERVKVDPSFRPPIGRLDKIIPISSHENLQRASLIAANCHQVGVEDEDADYSSDDNLLLDVRRSTLSRAGAKSHSSKPAIGAREGRLQHNSAKLKRLLEACWSKDPGARPQSVRALRIALCEAGAVTSSESWSASLPSESTRQPGGESFQQPTSLLKLYTKLLECTSHARERKLLSERQISARLRLALLPVASFTPTHSAPASFWRHHERVFVCLFRFLSLAKVTHAGRPQLEALNGLLAQLDERVESFRGHLHLWDSQVDSMMRFMVCASDPSSANPSECRQRIVRKSSLIPYNRISLLTTFAFELIDMANEWESKFEGQIQVRCALHLGQADGFCLIRPPHLGRDQTPHFHVLRLARYVVSGPAIEVAKILEQTGQPQRIHISTDYKAALLLEHEKRACFGAANQRLEFDLKSLLTSILGDTDANHATGEQQQPYVIIRRSNKIQTKVFDQETHWLLNGPRVTASQRLMLPLDEGRLSMD